MRLDVPDEFVEALAERVAVKVADRLRGEVMDHASPLTIREAAERLRVSESTVKVWIKTGMLGRVPNCSKVLIPAAEVAAMAAGRRAAG